MSRLCRNAQMFVKVALFKPTSEHIDTKTNNRYSRVKGFPVAYICEEMSCPHTQGARVCVIFISAFRTFLCVYGLEDSLQWNSSRGGSLAASAKIDWKSLSSHTLHRYRIRNLLDRPAQGWFACLWERHRQQPGKGQSNARNKKKYKGVIVMWLSLSCFSFCNILYTSM